ncbi:MAG: hypothetical protein AAF902_18935 [Chloroflexota bacterium]
MIDLFYYYATESNYLRLFILSILPILLFPAVILIFTRYVFYWFNPQGELSGAKMFAFVGISVLLSLIIMFAVLYFYFPHGTDLRVPILFIIVVFGLLGAGRLYLVEERQSRE